MSGWSMFELEDITWDVFGDNCDCIVPRSGAEQVNNFEAECDTHKKARHDILNVRERNIDYKGSTEDVFQESEEATFQSSLTDEKSQTVNCPPSHASKSILPLSHAPECVDEITTFASDDMRTSNSCFNGHNVDTNGDVHFSDNPTLINISVADLHHFSLEVSPAETDLDLQENESKDRENSNILDYDWPDVSSFDDVDKMLSYSSFGHGGSGNADELSWLSSSSYTVDGTEDTFKSGFQSSFSDLNALRDSSKTNMIIWPDNGIQTMDGDKTSSLDYELFTHWLEADVQDKVDFPSKREVTMQRNDSEGNHKLEQKGKLKTSEYASGNSYHVPGPVAQHDNQIYVSSSLAAPQTYFPHFAGSQIQFVEPDSSGYPHACNPYAEIEHSYILQQIPTVESTSCIKSPKEAKPSLVIHIPGEASNSGNQPMKKTLSPLSKSPTVIAAQKIEEMHLGQQLHNNVSIGYTNQKHASFSGLTNQDSTNNQLEKASQEHLGIDINPSFNRGSSCTDWSEDMLSSPKTFQQLQGVMDQLDIRTKLCIRDGLYRLARSAEQRHSVESSRPSCRDTMDSSKLIGIDKSKRCHRLMDVEIETGTNTIDRSIVHLLFSKDF